MDGLMGPLDCWLRLTAAFSFFGSTQPFFCLTMIALDDIGGF